MLQKQVCFWLPVAASSFSDRPQLLFSMQDYQSRIESRKSETRQSLLEPDFLRKLEQLSIVSKRAFSGQLKGEKRSTKRGTSVEFADYRDYSHGDDLRRVDWNTYA